MTTTTTPAERIAGAEREIRAIDEDLKRLNKEYAEALVLGDGQDPRVIAIDRQTAELRQRRRDLLADVERAKAEAEDDRRLDRERQQLVNAAIARQHAEGL